MVIWGYIIHMIHINGEQSRRKNWTRPPLKVCSQELRSNIAMASQKFTFKRRYIVSSVKHCDVKQSDRIPIQRVQTSLLPCSTAKLWGCAEQSSPMVQRDPKPRRHKNLDVVLPNADVIVKSIRVRLILCPGCASTIHGVWGLPQPESAVNLLDSTGTETCVDGEPWRSGALESEDDEAVAWQRPDLGVATVMSDKISSYDRCGL